jgi:hypothetical protein
VGADELAGLALRAIDEGLRSVLGENVTKTLYYHFEERSGLRMEDALKRPEGPELITLWKPRPSGRGGVLTPNIKGQHPYPL